MDSPVKQDWRALLREWRRRRGLTQAQLASHAGVSQSAIRSYEGGVRHPANESLTRVIHALGIPRQDANLIFTGAGYTIGWSYLLTDRYVFDMEFARMQLEQCPWPVFMSDQAYNVVATNRLMEKIFDVDLESEYLGPADRNLLGGASDPRFARYFANFDEVVSFMIGLAKGDPRFEQNMERPAPWLEEPMSRFLQGDPRLITRVMGLWDAAPAVPHRNRHQYEVRWLYRGEVPIRFVGVLTIGDLWNELSWNDWIPADPESWETLRQITL